MNPGGTARNGCLTKSSNSAIRHRPMIHATFPPWRYIRRIAFISTSATWHQNFRLALRRSGTPADAPACTDAAPARAGVSKSRTADAITAAPDVDSHAPAAVLGCLARPPCARHVASSPCQVTTSTIARRRAHVKPCQRPVRAKEPCRAALREFRRVMDMRVGARHGRSDTTAKVGPVGATHASRGTTRTLAGSVLE